MPRRRPIERVPRRVGERRGVRRGPRAKGIEPITIISPPTRPEVRRRPGRRLGEIKRRYAR